MSSMKRRQKTIALILTLLTVAVLALVWTLLLPAVERVKLSLAEKTELRRQYTEQVANIRQAEELFDNAGFLGGLPVTPELLTTALPPHREYEDLLAMIENMAISSGISSAVSITIQQPATTDTATTDTATTDTTAADTGFVTATPINITTTGDYGALKNFLDALQSGLRPVVIESMDVQPLVTGGVSITLTAKTYTRDTADKSAAAVSEAASDGETSNNTTNAF